MLINAKKLLKVRLVYFLPFYLWILHCICWACFRTTNKIWKLRRKCSTLFVNWRQVEKEKRSTILTAGMAAWNQGSGRRVCSELPSGTLWWRWSESWWWSQPCTPVSQYRRKTLAPFYSSSSADRWTQSMKRWANQWPSRWWQMVLGATYGKWDSG